MLFVESHFRNVSQTKYLCGSVCLYLKLVQKSSKSNIASIKQPNHCFAPWPSATRDYDGMAALILSVLQIFSWLIYCCYMLFLFKYLLWQQPWHHVSKRVFICLR